MWFRGTAGLCVLFVAALAGCSNGLKTAKTLRTVPVSGTLTFQGEPLESFRVTFYPKQGDRTSSGLTDAAGNFKLGTNTVGDGAPPGKYTVVVAFAPPELEDTTTAVPIDDPSKLPKPKVKVPEKYSSMVDSGLSAEVPPGGIRDLKIDLP